MESLVAVGIPTALILAMVGLPFYDRRSTRNLLHRPFALGSLVVILGGAGLLLGSAVRDMQPNAPPEAGRTLTSRELGGRALYRSQKCDECHRIAGKGGDKGPELTEIGLKHSSAWLHSYIEQPTRFRGDTTEMPSFGPPTLSHEEIEVLALYLASLRGKAGLLVTPQFRDTFPEPIRKP